MSGSLFFVRLEKMASGKRRYFSEQLETEKAARLRRDNQERAKERLTEKKWYLVDTAIKAFINKYPQQWLTFQEDMRLGQNESSYQEALPKHKELRKSHWRHTASFPIIYGRDPWTKKSVEVDSLLPVLKKIIPSLTNKKSRNFAEFLRRYPVFCPARKLNVSEY